jgi:mannonate dehydratase
MSQEFQTPFQFSMSIGPDPTDEQLLFVRQLGVPYVYTWVPDDQCDFESLDALRRKVEAAGLTLYNVGNFTVGKSDKIQLALPGRDETIAAFQDFIRNLGRAGIHTTTFTWESSGVWSSEPGESRGARARRVDLVEMRKRPFTHGREYTLDELWENFAYFIERVLPVAEESGVRLALHPNDPPTDSLGGIPCLINSFERYNRAYEIAGDSPYLGMEFCTGCWLEGGDAFGDMLAAIREFTKRGKIFIVHFRNITEPLPHFIETFLDNGYMDMYEVMKTFCEAGYDGSMILDHSPRFAACDEAATAYAIGYMRALRQRAEFELSSIR